MANPALYASGTQTATIGTEHFVSSPNAVGTYIFIIDLNAMQDGDFLEVRIYQMVLTSGTSRPFDVYTFQDAQPADQQIWMSIPMANDLTDTNSLRFSIKQTLPSGGGRNFPYKVLQYT